MNVRGLSALVLLVVVGCTERVVNPAPAPSSIATLTISGATRTPEAIVTITAKAQGSSGTRAGAFTARLEYDTSVLAYVGEGESTSGFVAFHDRDGVLKVAGASLEGFTESVLFHARFRVVKPLSSASIHLVIDELRDVSAGDRLPTDVGTRSAVLRPWR